jgi:uncharacterized protein
VKADADDRMFRVVLDTNIFVSALISDGKPRKLLKMGISNEFSIVASEPLLKELVTVFRRPKFETSEDEIREIVLALIRTCEIVAVKSRFDVVREDKKDNMIVNTAVDGKADVVVSGDKHLLELKNFRGIRIMSVDDMLEILQRSNDKA